ncbi:PEP-CTERM putative exosortase interaction domain-containing protein [Desulfocapsa sulfexigens DSM 10523]|uniref:PEP-CTERM putative exosortase interaction domain-containing protein n=1 Tax=Desulfocapsa sulfexigens (strain DSM 10523 / SB164P1) TaxID=1167006 RepID=M1PQN9_DESSD|nr:PEP-CTERM sorting domain-containing protein [Desulfocapsa sulfexigens]AGF78721.1 PEP-CTERM putative exosortase interaction domain-containing protein [Desulfocapsa sulfexigens DSM 10523]
MTKKIYLTAITGVFFLSLTSSVNATTINYFSQDSDADKTSVYTYFDNFLIETFNQAPINTAPSGSLDQSWTWTGSANVVNGSASGQYAAPFGTTSRDQSNYLSVPNPSSSGSITAQLGATYDYFGLWWGSVDTYNTISFFNGSTLTQSFTGSDIKNGNDEYGNQTAPSTNVYVNFLDLERFDSFVLTSTSLAFEIDNIAVGNAPVPEPATMLLFGTGLVGLSSLRFRKKKK